VFGLRVLLGSIMMRKPAAAPIAKASVRSAKRRRSATARTPAPLAKCLRVKQSVLAEATPERLFSSQALHRQLQDALLRVAAAEARENVACEQARSARDQCREAMSLAQRRSEHAADVEGQLKMLREVYDQMHEAYVGSMSIIKAVTACLPSLPDSKPQLAPLPANEEGTAHQPLYMLELHAGKSVDESNPLKTQRVRSLSPSPGRRTKTLTPNGGSCAHIPTTPVRESRAWHALNGQTEKAVKYSERPMSPTTRSASRHANADSEVEAKMDNTLMGRSDPRAVLNSMPWPSTINQWGSLQSKIWAGHASLPKHWLRIWSKSHDAEYYLCLRNRKTTFDIRDVK